MSLVNAKCTNCGGVLEVDNTKDAMMCQFCGSAFIVEKAIQNFNITNVTNNNIQTQIVHVHAPQKSDFEVNNGVLIGYSGSARIVTVPDEVTEIGESAFENCDYVHEVKLPNNITTIENKAFCNCTRLKKINLSDGLLTIGDKAFFKCENLSEISLPNSVKRIGTSAFQHCVNFNLTNLPKKLFELKSYAFANSGIKSLVSTNFNRITEYAFSDCVSLIKCVIGCFSIGEGAFKGCTRLRELRIEKAYLIDKEAFQNTGLCEISGLENVQNIYSNAFANTKVKEVTLQPKLERIHLDAFANSKVEKVILKDFGRAYSFHEYAMKKLSKSKKRITVLESGSFSGCKVKEVKLVKTKIKQCVVCFGDISFGKCTNCKTKYKK